MLRKLKIRLAKVLLGSALFIVPAVSPTACDQSLGRLLDLVQGSATDSATQASRRATANEQADRIHNFNEDHRRGSC